MSTIAFRIDEDKKNEFDSIVDSIWMDSSTVLRFFVNKVIKNPGIIKMDIDENLMNEVMQIWENSFSDVWDNQDDDIYSKLYKNA